MSMDPTKWIDFDQLSAEANSVKIEKLLDPLSMMQRPIRETATRTRK